MEAQPSLTALGKSILISPSPTSHPLAPSSPFLLPPAANPPPFFLPPLLLAGSYWRPLPPPLLARPCWMHVLLHLLGWGPCQQPSAASSDKLGGSCGEEECSGTCFGGVRERETKGAEGESGGWWQARLPSRLGGSGGGCPACPPPMLLTVDPLPSAHLVLAEGAITPRNWGFGSSKAAPWCRSASRA